MFLTCVAVGCCAYLFRKYARSSPKKHEEYQYLDLVRSVIDSGVEKADRTKVGTMSVFGRTMRFSLHNGGKCGVAALT